MGLSSSISSLSVSPETLSPIVFASEGSQQASPKTGGSVEASLASPEAGRIFPAVYDPSYEDAQAYQEPSFVCGHELSEGEQDLMIAGIGVLVAANHPEELLANKDQLRAYIECDALGTPVQSVASAALAQLSAVNH
jgi:hypothetical protein